MYLSPKTKKALMYLVIVVVALVLSVYVLGKNGIIFDFRSGASNQTQTITGQLKSGVSQDCVGTVGGDQKSGPRGIGTRSPSSAPYSVINSTMGQCVPLVANASAADNLVGKRVTAEGVLTNGIFYAKDIKEASNLENMPGVPTPKFTPTPTPKPTPTPIPCPGLKAKAACDPKATTADKKCCSPYTCTGTWNPVTAKTENYICASGVKAF